MARRSLIRPWISPDRGDTLEAERRARTRHRADEVVSAAVGFVRSPVRRVGFSHWLEAYRIIAQSRKLARISEEELVALAGAQRRHLLALGFQGRPLRTVAACVRELTGRTLGMRHHPVQIVGGLALLRGNIVEMATGEGKTITTLIPAICAALAGVPVHVVTVNPYLAARDRNQLAKVIEPLGLTCGLITDDTEHSERPDIYRSDVVFATNKDIAFDYLRDRIALGSKRSALAALVHRTLESHRRDETRTVSRGLGFAIVDEVDSILIDEAQTPLIITRESGDGDGVDESEVAGAFLALAASLEEDRHFRLDRSKRAAWLLAEADAIVEGLKPPAPAYVPLAARREALTQALSALHLFLRDEHYILTDDGIAIVDEFTGRVMADRKWQRGLHQMIETKEKIERSAPRETIAQITYQTFFARYLWFSGMTGTAWEVSRELSLSHERPVLRLPTHRRILRRESATRFYGSADAKWRAVVDDALRMVQRGRPVLIGTSSVGASETVAACFERAGHVPIVLNARQDAEEAAIIARAGEAGRITVATNMAGRGTDIPVPEAVRRNGGLHVILTEFHASARIDRQLIGRTGRQGQPGTSVAIVSLEDRLFISTVPRLSWLVRLLTLGRAGRLPGWMAEFLRLVAQARQERLGRRRRARTIRQSRKLARSLGFRPDGI